MVRAFTFEKMRVKLRIKVSETEKCVRIWSEKFTICNVVNDVAVHIIAWWYQNVSCWKANTWYFSLCVCVGKPWHEVYANEIITIHLALSNDTREQRVFECYFIICVLARTLLLRKKSLGLNEWAKTKANEWARKRGRRVMRLKRVTSASLEYYV